MSNWCTLVRVMSWKRVRLWLLYGVWDECIKRFCLQLCFCTLFLCYFNMICVASAYLQKAGLTVSITPLVGVGALICGCWFCSSICAVRNSDGSEGWSKSKQYIQECSQTEGEISPGIQRSVLASGVRCRHGGFLAFEVLQSNPVKIRLHRSRDVKSEHVWPFGAAERCMRVWCS